MRTSVKSNRFIFIRMRGGLMKSSHLLAVMQTTHREYTTTHLEVRWE